jgi:hypothetical protein
MPLAGETATASVLSVGIPYSSSPLSSSSSGTPSSGTTETFDTVLGYYQPTLIAGHRYWVGMYGLVGNCGVASDVYYINIRDSGSTSTPTSSSTLVAAAQWTSSSAGSASRVPIPLGNTFVVAAGAGGVHTFGMSSVRISGTGSFTPLFAPNLFRELLVLDLGGN